MRLKTHLFSNLCSPQKRCHQAADRYRILAALFHVTFSILHSVILKNGRFQQSDMESILEKKKKKKGQEERLCWHESIFRNRIGRVKSDDEKSQGFCGINPFEDQSLGRILIFRCLLFHKMSAKLHTMVRVHKIQVFKKTAIFYSIF